MAEEEAEEAAAGETGYLAGCLGQHSQERQRSHHDCVGLLDHPWTLRPSLVE